MGNFTLNSIFAFVFAGFAWNSLPRGWRFFKIGWLAFRANEENLSEEFDVERQRDMSVGSNFLIAGVAWLVGGIVCAILAIMFALFAIFNVGIFNFIS
ncbi:MAG: hypothetical protein Phog2KO_18400 [Phototrophicaceae bacterium]